VPAARRLPLRQLRLALEATVGQSDRRCRAHPIDLAHPRGLSRHVRSPTGRGRAVVRGVRCSGKRVARLMRAAGPHGIPSRRRRGLTRRRPRVAPHPDLVNRAFAAEDLDRLWVADISYVPTGQGWLYLATILDCCSRRIVGYSMDRRMKASLAVAALRNAIGLKGSGEHHRALGPRQPDRVQGFTRRLRQAGIAASMGGVGTAYDSAAAREPVRDHQTRARPPSTASRRERLPERQSSSSSRSSTRRRLHSSIGMMAPAEFERRVRARLEEATVP
jgi:putative transposase